MRDETRALVVSHTHWDRAWYVPFQEYRARLVRLIDRLIDLLETQPDYRVFTLDGQMAVLEDYLEVRHDQAARLKRLCRDGRLKVGPWYVLADEYLVDPESLIRNLMLGHRIGQEYGGVAKIGYVPDGFGHVAQLPQILRGFGIDNAFFWRGVGNEGDELGTEFNWQAPDGSSVLAIWMPWGYHAISNLGYPIHWGDTSQMAFDQDLALDQIAQAVARLKPMTNTGDILLMNGIDHEEAEPRVPEILRLANQVLEIGSIHHGTLEEHVDNVRAAGDPAMLPQFAGEFRWGKCSEILQGVYSTRVHLKQHNHETETLLLHYAEPLSALAWASGADVPAGTHDLLWTAWRSLLQNHAHDDIYGCGADTVHEEMLYRFSQADQIGQVIVRDSLRQLSRQVDFTAQPGMPLLVFNPLAWDREEMAEGPIDFDFDDPTAEDFQLVDAAGRLVEHQVLDDQDVFWMETLKANRKRRVTIAFPAAVPACGYQSYFVQARAQDAQVEFDEWEIFPYGVENRYLSLRIAADGGLSIYDKASGKRYEGLNHFYDVEDAGDAYSYCPAQHSQEISTRGGTARCRIAVQGPNLATFKIDYHLQIPEGLTEDRARRADKLVGLPLSSWATVYRDQPGVFIETVLTNRARDHKLSVAFPVGLNADRAMVDSAFLVTERPFELPDATGWVEDPTPLMHQRAFLDISDGTQGLAILNRGLPSIEVTRRDDRHVVDLTLLRSVGWLSRDDLSTRRVAAGPLVPTPGAQCLGDYRFEYAVLPHTGDWRAVYSTAYNTTAALKVVRADTHEGLELREMNITGDDPSLVRPIPWPRGGPLPGTLSFLRSAHPGLVLSALVRSEDGRGLMARFYNILPEPVSARIESGLALRSVSRTNLNQQVAEPIVLDSPSAFTVDARPHEVFSLLLLFEKPSAG